MSKKIVLFFLLGLSFSTIAEAQHPIRPPLPPVGYCQCYASNVSGATWFANSKYPHIAQKRALGYCRHESRRVVKLTCHIRPDACVCPKPE